MTRALDPFPAGPDVSAYVPSAELEQSLAYLAAKLDEAPGWVGVCGPPGVGKTLVLRLLLRRQASRMTPVYVPSAQLDVDGLERWIESSVPGRKAEPARALAVRLQGRGKPLLLGLDEAQWARPELAGWLAEFCSAETGARAVLAWSELEGARIPPALARCPARVFVEPLPLARVPHYIAVQLARVNAGPELRAALSGRTLERIALASGGNQRQIQRLADAELAAQAWRARVVPRAASAAGAARATESAPRGARLASGAAAAPAPSSATLPWVLVGVLSVALALALTALALK